jgi:hypothetical protein
MRRAAPLAFSEQHSALLTHRHEIDLILVIVAPPLAYAIREEGIRSMTLSNI